MMRRLLSSQRLGALLLLFGLAACSGGAKNQTYIEKPVDDLYNNSMDQLISEIMPRRRLPLARSKVSTPIRYGPPRAS